ncbi:MAG: uroporphyrinogen-III synthase [Ignavibacteriales bacterium]|nr:uroporphyrinogen-III synthase [Ignavibacteriales bacterium]
MQPITGAVNENSLAGKTIVVTRGEEQGIESKSLLESFGAKVLLFPAIGFSGRAVSVKIKERLLNAAFDFIVFPSQNAVKFFFTDFGSTTTLNSLAKVVAVGTKTTVKLSEYNVKADIVPELQSAAGIIEKMKSLRVSGKSALIVSSDLSRPELEDGLQLLGMHVTKAIVYVNGLPDAVIQADLNTMLGQHIPDAFMFTSPSTFRNFIIIAGVSSAAYFTGKQVVGIGPTTVGEMEKFGLSNILQPQKASFAGMANTLISFFKTEKMKTGI